MDETNSVENLTPATVVDDAPIDPSKINPEHEQAVLAANAIKSAEEKMDELKSKLPDYSQYGYGALVNERRRVADKFQQAKVMYESLKQMQDLYSEMKDTLGEEAFEETIKEISQNTDSDVAENLVADPKDVDTAYENLKNLYSIQLQAIEKEIITRFPDADKSIKFLDQEGIANFEHQIEKLKATKEKMLQLANDRTEEKDKKPFKTARIDATIAALENQVAAIKDRRAMTYWMNKAKHPGAVRQVEKRIRGDFEGNLQKALHMVCTLSAHDDSYGNVFYTALIGMSKAATGLAVHPVAVHLFLAHMYHIYTTRKNGEDHNVAVFVSTINALMRKAWDYEERPEPIIAQILLAYAENSSEFTRKEYQKKQWTKDVQTRMQPVIDAMEQKEATEPKEKAPEA